METLQELKKRHEQELNTFIDNYVFFAFNNEQLEEGLKKLNCSKNDVIGFVAGGIILKNKVADYISLSKRHKSELTKKAKEDKEAQIKLLVYELGNHEYGYTGDPTDAIKSLGFKVSKTVLNKAIEQYNYNLNQQE